MANNKTAEMSFSLKRKRRRTIFDSGTVWLIFDPLVSNWSFTLFNFVARIVVVFYCLLLLGFLLPAIVVGGAIRYGTSFLLSPPTTITTRPQNGTAMSERR